MCNVGQLFPSKQFAFSSHTTYAEVWTIVETNYQIFEPVKT
jgi:hypothetical protein